MDFLLARFHLGFFDGEVAAFGVRIGVDDDAEEGESLCRLHGLVRVDDKTQRGEHLLDTVQVLLALGLGAAADEDVVREVHNHDAFGRQNLTDLGHECVHVSGERLAAKNGPVRDVKPGLLFQLHAHKERVVRVDGQLIERLVEIHLGHEIAWLQQFQGIKNGAVFKRPAVGVFVEGTEIQARPRRDLFQVHFVGEGRLAGLDCPDVGIEGIELVEVALMVLSTIKGAAHPGQLGVGLDQIILTDDGEEGVHQAGPPPPH